MRICFLDIDGVLCTQKSMQEARELGKTEKSSRLREAFDKDTVTVFNSFIERTNAKVVISSAWRTGQNVQSMQEMFDRNGIKCKIVGLTPDNPEGIRGLEILDWLNNSKRKIKDYIVIDDEIFDMADYIPKEKIIYVEGGIMGKGLEEHHLKGVWRK